MGFERFGLFKKIRILRSEIIYFSATSTSSRIFSIGSSLCFLKLVEGPDLPVVFFPILVVD